MIAFPAMRAVKIFLWVLGLATALYLRGEPTQVDAQAVTLLVSNPACVQSATRPGACYITVRSISASSSDPNFNRIEISIDGKTRLRMTAFFETSIYFSGQMLGKGLQVTCGRPNASGVAGYGRIYPVNISAFVTGSSPITDIANVTCPAYESITYLPLINR